MSPNAPPASRLQKQSGNRRAASFSDTAAEAVRTVPSCPSSATAIERIDRLIPMAELCAITSFSKASIYRKIAEGTFPAPLKIGASRVAWRSSQVESWILACGAAAKHDIEGN